MVKERTLEVIAEIPEDVNTAIGNGQQNGEESSPVQLVTEGNRIITSISQTLDQVAKFPMREDLPPSQLNVRSQANVPMTSKLTQIVLIKSICILRIQLLCAM